ncbi:MULTISPECIES: redoxin domain-containing protein [Halomicrobium]|uniref:Alkyl hydroperoxide reductase/ Thiol specific antioxidant/ Mal allergen n=2 Tax=Halomicrobium mukohataei TaxID=57705 RepID=C7P1W9_HALMD|nr:MULTISPECIES: redoxin domain-containing protein [Halomicrobium]ACV49209.1 alkyl hydroperoxide reductase/ Thiol specific antioxidant/ Mal allergen [Halomicrobium mukohataei DSM 12286]QCD64614.1 redoxin domain-containing protein [Halomicrobium mukohataei]QFR19421.1 redoxin domain-containing protein [Halomicrobium sp. ZPS1]
MLDAGDPAPDFDLPRPTADGDQTYRLSAAASEAPVVVAFVAPDDAGTALLRNLAVVDWSRSIDRLSVFGVVVADLDTVGALATDLDLPFPLLADPNAFFAERYDALAETPGGRRPRHALFVVDRSCRFRFAWRADGPAPDPPIDDVLGTLASL